VWRRNRWGINIGDGYRRELLCNLRFADDILLLAPSKRQLKRMLQDLADVTAKVGLEIHMGKTSVLCNVPDAKRSGPDTMRVNEEEVKVLPFAESAMYLGREFSFEDMHIKELRHRINRGWAKFHQYKRELSGRHYPLLDRLRLFEAVVTPTLLYSAGTWTMTSGMVRELKVAQRRMLRRIVGVHRKRKSKTEDDDDKESDTEDEDESDASETDEGDDMFEEPWEEWIRRATGIAEGHAKKAKVRDWVSAQRWAKWSLAGHIARRTDGRWSRKCLDWQPEWGQRKVGRPCKRWADDIEEFIMNEISMEPNCTGRQWTELTADRMLWRTWQLKFCI
jgi:hypothetical protein